MDERLYRLRPDQGVFETGTARGRQLLLATNANDILLHWFTPNGNFLNLERVPISSDPSAHIVKDKAKLQSQVVWGPKWWGAFFAYTGGQVIWSSRTSIRSRLAHRAAGRPPALA